MKKMSKRKWDWIKYWGHHYQVIFPINLIRILFYIIINYMMLNLGINFLRRRNLIDYLE